MRLRVAKKVFFSMEPRLHRNSTLRAAYAKLYDRAYTGKWRPGRERRRQWAATMLSAEALP